MKIVFIGCVESSRLFLETIISHHLDIALVVTKKTAGINADYCDLSSICIDNEISMYHTSDVNDDKTIEAIRECNPDIILCLGWSQLLKEELLSIPRVGCIGFHPANLPFNRGRHPIIWALALGLDCTASTLFLMDKGADTGKILSQEKILIEYKDDAASLYYKIMDKAVIQLIDVLNKIECGNVEAIPQKISEGSTWRKRGKEDGKIDWRMSSRAIYNLVRALTKPYVGAHFTYEDREYKVWKVREIECDCNNIEPGKVLDFCNEEITIKTGDGAIKLVEYDSVDVKIGTYL